MPEKHNHDQPLARMAPGSVSEPTPRSAAGKRLPLNSLEAVGRELDRLYRDARSGQIATAEASRLAYILSTLGKVLEAGVIEARLTALENMANDQEPDPY